MILLIHSLEDHMLCDSDLFVSCMYRSQTEIKLSLFHSYFDNKVLLLK